jgi:hypothetical protein
VPFGEGTGRFGNLILVSGIFDQLSKMEKIQKIYVVVYRGVGWDSGRVSVRHPDPSDGDISRFFVP